MDFLTVVAWIFGVISTWILITRIYCAATYTENDAIHDCALGIHRKFPIFLPGITAIICWAWVITS